VKARRRARFVAIQVLYEIDCAGHPPGRVLQQRLEAVNLPEPAREFVRRMVMGVIQSKNVLDPFIQRHASEWPLEQMAYIDRNILRLALYEFAVVDETPMKVAINEAVELAKIFGSDSSPRFVNGVLGALVPLKEEIARQVEVVRQSNAGEPDS